MAVLIDSSIFITAERHGVALEQLVAAGQPIVATALAHDSVVLTDRIRDFKRIPRLVLHRPPPGGTWPRHVGRIVYLWREGILDRSE